MTGPAKRGRHRRAVPVYVKVVRVVGVGGVGLICWLTFYDPPDVEPVMAEVVDPGPLRMPSVPLTTTEASPTTSPPTSRPSPPTQAAPTTTRSRPPATTRPAPKTTTQPPRTTTRPAAPSTTKKAVPSPAPAPAAAAPTGDVITAARGYIGSGIPYVWGGKTSAGMDCSGWIWNVYKKAGYSFPYRASSALKAWAEPVSRSNARPGDLVFWPGHVAIYAGGDRIVDMSASQRGVTERSMWGSPTFGRVP